MEIYSNLLKENIQFNKRSAVALGKFDGLHKGHMSLISMLMETKKNEDVDAIVFTFVKSPKEALKNESYKYILTMLEKRNFMEHNKVDALVECPIDKELLSMKPEIFIRDILVKRLAVKQIVCGEDFRFGHNRRGDVNLLKSLESEYDYKTTVIKKLQHNNRDISSTYIREEIAKGNISVANELLGYPYTVIGQVAKGMQLGRTIGFPTINIIPEVDKLLPPNGVYYTKVFVDDTYYRAITNIGTKPTVNGDKSITIETNLLDDSLDLYGKNVKIEFFEFVRPEKKFESLEELKATIAKDVEKCRKEFRLVI